MELQILHKELFQGPLCQVCHDAAVFIGHPLPHPGDLPGTGHDPILGYYLGNHAEVQHILSGELPGGHHIVVAALGAEIMLCHQTHAVAGHQSAVSVGHLHDRIVCGDGHVAEHGGIPVEARAGNGTDGGNVQVKDHILDQVGVIEILMLEPLGGQFGIGLPAVGVGFDHPGVADVGENDDLVFDVQGQNPHQLRNCPMGHAGVLHGAVVGFPGDL